jgi:hypothetical protein
MFGRAMALVLYVGWPCALALVVGLAGLQVGQDSIPAGRRLSTSVYGKFEALSICVQSVTGERREAELARDLVDASVGGLGVSGVFRFTMPAMVDAGCPREAAHYGANGKSRRVANRGGDSRPAPSPYQLHVFLMPETSLKMLNLEPDLAGRRVVVEEYAFEGMDGSAAMAAVTFGLYATLDEIQDSAELRQFFRHALQMKSQLGAPPPRVAVNASGAAP